MTTTATPLDRLLPILEVCSTVSRSRASIYRNVKAERFPKTVKSGASSRWLASEIQAHIAALPCAA